MQLLWAGHIQSTIKLPVSLSRFKSLFSLLRREFVCLNATHGKVQCKRQETASSASTQLEEETKTQPIPHRHYGVRIKACRVRNRRPLPRTVLRYLRRNVPVTLPLHVWGLVAWSAWHHNLNSRLVAVRRSMLPVSVRSNGRQRLARPSSTHRMKRIEWHGVGVLIENLHHHLQCISMDQCNLDVDCGARRSAASLINPPFFSPNKRWTVLSVRHHPPLAPPGQAKASLITPWGLIHGIIVRYRSGTHRTQNAPNRTMELSLGASWWPKLQ